MKYKALSILVVVTTTLSVVAMLLSSSSQNDLKQKESIKVSQDQSNNKQSTNTDSIKEKVNENSDTNITKKNKETEVVANAKNNERDKTELSSSIPKEQSFVVIDNRNVKEINKQNSQQQDYPDSVAVFKIESTTIEDNLSIVEKAKLLTVAAKISPVDYAKISNYLYDENSTRGIINTFSLLKERLSERDYEKVKDVASKYMDVKCIESYIK